MASGPLADVKVLDFSRLLPGPYATLCLTDLGATVDKVEDPQGGDPIRQMPPQWRDQSALFYALHRNKRSIALDLKRPESVAVLKRLVRRYDVVVESFRPGVMDKLGLSYAALSAEKSELIYCSISGYGQTGPDRLKAGHDLDYVARSGVLDYGGARNGPPAMPGVQLGDIGGGSLFAVVGILAALHESRRTHRGRHVDISMTEGALAFMHMQLSARLMLGGEAAPLRRGAEPLNGGYPGYGIYRTQDDRYLAVGALEPKFLSAVLQRLGREELLADAYDLGEGGQKVRAELERIFASQPRAHWLSLFADADACVEPVQGADEVLADPQFQARGVFATGRDNALAQDVTYLRTPLSWDDARFTPAPALGAQGRQILLEAGFTPDEMATVGI